MKTINETNLSKLLDTLKTLTKEDILDEYDFMLLDTLRQEVETLIADNECFYIIPSDCSKYGCKLLVDISEFLTKD